MSDWQNPSYTKDKKTYAKQNGESESPQLIQLEPIGVVSSPYQERFGTPRQPAYAVKINLRPSPLIKGLTMNKLYKTLKFFRIFG